MLIGYAWVSTDEEAFDLQKEALDRAGVDRLYADVTSRSRREAPATGAGTLAASPRGYPRGLEA